MVTDNSNELEENPARRIVLVEEQNYGDVTNTGQRQSGLRNANDMHDVEGPRGREGSI